MDEEEIEPEMYRVRISVAGAIDSLDEDVFAYFDDALEYYFEVCEKYQNDDLDVEVTINDTLANKNVMKWRSMNPDDHEDHTDGKEI